MYNIQNAFAIAILSRIDINGIAITDEPRWVISSEKFIVLFWMSNSNGGMLNDGKPDATFPIILLCIF